VKRSQSPPSHPERAGPSRRPPALRGPLLLAVALVVAAVAAAWIAIASRDDQGAAPPSTHSVAPGAAAERHVYLLRGSGRPEVRVSLEVAADEPARERGLSNRTQVPKGTGMVFLFPADTTAAFWMKDTLVPLQIAFAAADGRVVSLFEMTPCRADPCPVYTPTAAYRYAIELPAGAFTDAGVRAGDQAVPQDPSALPQAS
jgi:uncharacterized protein